MLIKTLFYTLLRLTFLAPEPRQNFLIGMRTLSLITLVGGLGRHIDVKPVFLKNITSAGRNQKNGKKNGKKHQKKLPPQ